MNAKQKWHIKAGDIILGFCYVHQQKRQAIVYSFTGPWMRCIDAETFGIIEASIHGCQYVRTIPTEELLLHSDERVRRIGQWRTANEQ